MRYSVDEVIEKINSLEDSEEDRKIELMKKIKQGISISIALVLMNLTVTNTEKKVEVKDETYYSNQLIISEEEKYIIEQKLGRQIEEDENTLVLSGISSNNNLSEDEKKIFYEFVDMLNDNIYLDKKKAYESLKKVDIVYEDNADDYGYYNKIIGIYSKKDNQIKIFEEDNENNVKQHEIIHCIFSVVDNLDLPSFFIEGVTELLTNEYFASNPFIEVKSYPYEITMVKMLADIVGSDVVLETYSKGNINILKEALANKMPNTDIDKFIENIDTVFLTYESKNTVEKEKLKAVIKEFDNYYLELLNDDYTFDYALYEHNREILNLLFTDSPNTFYIEYLTKNGYYTKTYFSTKLKEQYPEIKKKDYYDNLSSENVAKKYKKII